MQEIWKKIPSYPWYEASSLGRVRSRPRTVVVHGANRDYERLVGGKVLKSGIVNGYCSVTLINVHGSKGYYVHRVVARTFIGKAPKGKDHVMHKDDDTQNNRVKNLRWCTPKENMDDRDHKDRVTHGSDHGLSVLNEKKVIRIRIRLNAGERGIDLAQEYGVSTSVISTIKTGRAWMRA